MTCRDCLHWDACKNMLEAMGHIVDGDGQNADKRCSDFADKSRFVELPYRPRDKVWVIDEILDRDNGGFKKVICEGEIIKVSYNAFSTPAEWIDYRWDSLMFGQSERHNRVDLCIGKTVFLTREAAEEALKGEQHD